MVPVSHLKRRWRTQRGTTLIETIIATTVLAILSTVALGGVLFGISQTRTTFNRATAAAWVEAEFDFLHLVESSGLTGWTNAVFTEPSSTTLTQTTGYRTFGAIVEPTIPKYFDHAVVAVGCYSPATNCPAYVVQVTVTLYTGPSTIFYVLSTYVSNATHL